MISGDVLKYRNGFLIRECYETVISGSSEFPLTLPEEAIFESLSTRNSELRGMLQAVEERVAKLGERERQRQNDLNLQDQDRTRD